MDKKKRGNSEGVGALQRWANSVTGVLKRERTRRGLTQAEVGLNLGVTQSRVRVMESHPERVRVERLFLALHLLGLELVVRERTRPEPAPAPEVEH
jgi:HTH-type transcriptional regulator/antitoxin HipB